MPLIVIILLLGAVICYFFYTWVARTSYTTLMTELELTEFQKNFRITLVLLGFTTLCCSGTIFMTMTLLLHKIAGPLVPIHRFIDELIAGNYDVSDVHLRDKDELKELADKLNTLKGHLKSGPK